MQTNGEPTDAYGRARDDLTVDPTVSVTVADAAKLLGLSAEAVRMRVKRGTLASKKIAGTVYVLLDRTNIGTNDQPDERTNDQRYSGPNRRTNDQPTEDLVEALREQNAAQEEQIRWLRREVERKDAILLRMAERMPELEAPEAGSRDAREAPPAPRGDPETASPRSDKGTAPEGYQEPTERRSWLYRFFFGP